MASLPDVDIKVTVAYSPEIRERMLAQLDREITEQRHMCALARRSREFWTDAHLEAQTRLDDTLAERERIASPATTSPKESK